VIEPLVGLETRQTQGRSAFEREQGAGVAQKCGDDLLGCGPGVAGDTLGGGLWASRATGAGGGPIGLGTKPVTVNPPMGAGGARGSFRSQSPPCWRTAVRRSTLKAAAASARGSARVRREWACQNC
jgi:hypothetical protein